MNRLLSLLIVLGFALPFSVGASTWLMNSFIFYDPIPMVVEINSGTMSITHKSGVTNVKIDWGDEVVESFSASGEVEQSISHTYASTGVWNVTISGKYEHPNFINQGTKIKNLIAGGNTGATSLDSMFDGCTSLDSIDFTDWDLSGVTTMNRFLADVHRTVGYTGVMSVPAVVSMDEAFRYLNSSSADTLPPMRDLLSVQSMKGLFYDTSWASIDFTPWGIPAANVVDTEYMFYSCSPYLLTVTGLPKIGDASYMFYDVDSLNPLPTIDYSGATETDYMFGLYSNAIVVPAVFDLPKVINAEGMFRLTQNFAPPANWVVNMPLATNVSHMFESGMDDIGSGNTVTINASSAVLANDMFQGSWDLSTTGNSITLNLNFGSALVDMSRMFYSSIVRTLNLNFTGTSTAETTYQMFYYAYATIIDGLETLDLSSVVDTSDMFYNLDDMNWSLTHPEDMTMNTTTPINMDRMFYSVSGFNTDLSDWGVVKPLSMYNMFAGGVFNNSSIVNWDTSNCISFRGTFSGNTVFNQDISGWDVSSGENFTSMFLQASAFSQDLSGWNTASATNFTTMFKQAPVNFSVATWNTSNVELFTGMFYLASSWNQSHASWDFTGITTGTVFVDFLSLSNMSVANYDATITNLYNQRASLPDSVTWTASAIQYSTSNQYIVDYFVNTKSWSWSDGGPI